MPGMQVLLGAGDTFRAAAAEQLQLWADRSGVDVHTVEGKNVRPDNVLYQTVDRVRPMKAIDHIFTAAFSWTEVLGRPMASP